MLSHFYYFCSYISIIDIFYRQIIVMKTDLKKILAVGGQSGLFNYLAHTRGGAIIESIVTKKRTSVGIDAKITSLADISIYTDEGEAKLQEVLESMHAILGEKDAPSSKSNPAEIKALFAEALPNYDADRFYVSHMKKVVDWYNCLKNYASLDFEQEEQQEEQQEQN